MPQTLLQVCISVNKYVCVYIYMYVDIGTYIYIYIYMYIHVYIDTYRPYFTSTVLDRRSSHAGLHLLGGCSRLWAELWVLLPGM